MSEVHLCCLSFLGITALESKHEHWEAAFCSLVSREIPGPLAQGWLPWGLLSTGYLLLNCGFSTIKWHKSESGHFRMNITAWRPPCPTKSCFEDPPVYDLSDDASALKVKGRGKDSLQITELWPYALAEFQGFQLYAPHPTCNLLPSEQELHTVTLVSSCFSKKFILLSPQGFYSFYCPHLEYLCPLML